MGGGKSKPVAKESTQCDARTAKGSQCSRLVSPTLLGVYPRDWDNLSSDERLCVSYCMQHMKKILKDQLDRARAKKENSVEWNLQLPTSGGDIPVVVGYKPKGVIKTGDRYLKLPEWGNDANEAYMVRFDTSAVPEKHAAEVAKIKDGLRSKLATIVETDWSVATGGWQNPNVLTFTGTVKREDQRPKSAIDALFSILRIFKGAPA